ncbi:potassium channel family protein [Streptomyces radicis]|uniref:Ion channel protein n=1 Tax=Streptomyces radicis TaxID=1750517 RepID=A0A3A9WGC7_9ACTN|nr:potassium channel family protein [Streptomyces radicis]RKN11363.1 Ion channel protein [Streptomyces radicis]RKN26615.1 Ion channel protein [Streptomyces radicis]
MRFPASHPARARADDLSHGASLPRYAPGPLAQVIRRLLMALAVLATAVVLVYFDRAGYHDNQGGEVGFIDSLYYVTVSLSTTGYGDVVPATDTARLITTFLITPLRVLFLIILVGTTLEVLTERTRDQWRLSHWRKNLRDHTVIVGFGTKGRSAAETLMSAGLARDQIVVVDPSTKVVELANVDGYAGVVGDATRSDVLIRARADRAKQVVISTQRDDTAVLVALTVRQLSTTVRIVASVREEENVPLLRQSGADAVITSASAVGRMLGLSVISPSSGAVMEDLIQHSKGLSLRERPVTKAEAGRSPRETDDLVVSVIRGHQLLPFDAPDAATLELTDRLVVIQRARPEDAKVLADKEKRERGPGSWRIPRR